MSHKLLVQYSTTGLVFIAIVGVVFGLANDLCGVVFGAWIALVVASLYAVFGLGLWSAHFYAY